MHKLVLFDADMYTGSFSANETATTAGTGTGWSSTTVIYDFFLTGTKKQKNPITQWFL